MKYPARFDPKPAAHHGPPLTISDDGETVTLKLDDPDDTQPVITLVLSLFRAIAIGRTIMRAGEQE